MTNVLFSVKCEQSLTYTKKIVVNMEVVVNEKTMKQKKGFWNAFISFLAMGGFLVVLVVGVVIAILISTWTQ